MIATATAVLSVPVWLYVAWSDVARRSAPNAAFGLLGGMGLVGLAAVSPPAVALSVAVLYPAVVWLYATGRMGGADAKALFVVPLLYPANTFTVLLGTALMAVPWLYYRKNDRGTPLLVPLSGGVFLMLGLRFMF